MKAGFDVTLRFFLPVDPNDADTIQVAGVVLRQAANAVIAVGERNDCKIENVLQKSTFISRRQHRSAGQFTRPTEADQPDMLADVEPAPAAEASSVLKGSKAFYSELPADEPGDYIVDRDDTADEIINRSSAGWQQEVL